MGLVDVAGEVVGVWRGERTEARRSATFVGDVLWRRGLCKGRSRWWRVRKKKGILRESVVGSKRSVKMKGWS